MWIETRTYPTIETTKQKEIKEKQESKSEKQERLIIFWLKQKW